MIPSKDVIWHDRSSELVSKTPLNKVTRADGLERIVTSIQKEAPKPA